MQDYRSLKVWQKAHELALVVYATSKSFPQDERYGLTSQLRRSAASVPSNLAEGCGRGGVRELIQLTQIAFGSSAELDYQLMLSRDLHYLDGSAYEELSRRAQEVQRMLGALLRTLRARAVRPHVTKSRQTAGELPITNHQQP